MKTLPWITLLYCSFSFAVEFPPIEPEDLPDKAPAAAVAPAPAAAPQAASPSGTPPAAARQTPAATNYGAYSYGATPEAYGYSTPYYDPGYYGYPPSYYGAAPGYGYPGYDPYSYGYDYGYGYGPGYGYSPYPPGGYARPVPRGSRGPGGFDFMPWGGDPKSFMGTGPDWSNREGGFGPFPQGPKVWFGDDPKTGLEAMWDDMLESPGEMGQMPGGWYFPSVSTPNPVDVADQFQQQSRNLQQDAPGLMQDWFSLDYTPYDYGY